MFWENFIRLCNEKEVKPNNVASSLGIPSGSVTDWKNGRKPRSTTLQKIADYFGVSTDYLLGKTEQKEKSSSIKDEDLKVALFGGDGDVPEEAWDEVRRFAEYVKQKYKK